MNIYKCRGEKGRGLPRPSGWTDIADKILKIQEIFIDHPDHNLHGGEGNLKKGPTLIFALKRAWPATPLRMTQWHWKKFQKFYWS